MKIVRKKIFSLPVTLRTATFFDRALFCFRAKQMIENSVYKQKYFSYQRKNTELINQPTFHFYFF